MSATATHFIVAAKLLAEENGKEVFKRDWEEHIERDLL